MERRVLGGTGISVSGFALGTMMLGAMGKHRPRRVDPHDPYARWMPASTSSTPPTSTPGESRRRSSGRPWLDVATRWCWPPSSDSQWAATLTGRGGHPAGSSGRWTQASGALALTTSIFTSCTGPTTARISTRPWVPCPT